MKKDEYLNSKAYFKDVYDFTFYSEYAVNGFKIYLLTSE